MGRPTKPGWYWVRQGGIWSPGEVRERGGKRKELEARMISGDYMLRWPLKWTAEELWGPELEPPRGKGS